MLSGSRTYDSNGNDITPMSDEADGVCDMKESDMIPLFLMLDNTTYEIFAAKCDPVTPADVIKSFIRQVCDGSLPIKARRVN